MNRYVIIGNGIAATGCIEGIRSRDKEGLITVLSKEKYPAYCRPLISYYLEGKTDLEKIKYRSDSFYSDNGCNVLNADATAIDREKKIVKTSDGTKTAFTSLCVASGSSPFIPHFNGLETVEKKFSFITLDDTIALENAITAESRVLIIGAGLIGLKCAEGLSKRVKSITVCDLSDRILSSILDAYTEPMVREHLEDNGIRFMLGDSVEEFSGNKAIMKSGSSEEFDILVIAVGVKANTGLVADIGGKINKGIVVDCAMHTSVDGIFAAGDCTEGYDASGGTEKVLALFPNAYIQGFTAGVNMAGGDEEFTNAIPMNSIGLFGMHIMTAGTYYTEENGGTVYKTNNKQLKEFFVRDGLLKGYIFINYTERVGIYTSLIREKIPLDTVDFDLLRENASFMAFSAEKRSEKFGGVV